MNTDTHELTMAAMQQRHYAMRLAAAPDCRDPEHIGCPGCDGRLEERQEEMKQAFLTAALRTVTAPATFAPKVNDYSLGVGSKFQRHQTVAEVFFDALNYTRGPELEDVFQLLADAARGEDIRPKALALVDRMAEKYAEMNVEAA